MDSPHSRRPSFPANSLASANGASGPARMTLAQLEARAQLKRPILVHAILETALGVANVEEIAAASPRMQGL